MINKTIFFPVSPRNFINLSGFDMPTSPVTFLMPPAAGIDASEQAEVDPLRKAGPSAFRIGFQ